MWFKDGSVILFDSLYVDWIDLCDGFYGFEGFNKLFVDNEVVVVYLVIFKFVEGCFNVFLVGEGG